MPAADVLSGHLHGLASALLDALDDTALRELATRLRPHLRDEPERLLDACEAGGQLGLHPETITRMARTGKDLGGQSRARVAVSG